MLTGKALQDAIVQALEDSADLLAVGYCQSSWARDKEGKSVKPEDESACEWCMEGAFIAVTVQKYDPEDAKKIQEHCVAFTQMANKQFYDAVRRNTGSGSTYIHEASVIPQINDKGTTTQSMVVRFVSRGAQLARMAIFGG